jgi:hypothetical protein
MKRLRLLLNILQPLRNKYIGLADVVLNKSQIQSTSAYIFIKVEWLLGALGYMR